MRTCNTAKHISLGGLSCYLSPNPKTKASTPGSDGPVSDASPHLKHVGSHGFSSRHEQQIAKPVKCGGLPCQGLAFHVMSIWLALKKNTHKTQEVSTCYSLYTLPFWISSQLIAVRFVKKKCAEWSLSWHVSSSDRCMSWYVMYQMTEKSGLDGFDSHLISTALVWTLGDADRIWFQPRFSLCGSRWFRISLHAIVAGREHFQHWETWMISCHVSFASLHVLAGSTHLLCSWMTWA